MGQDSQVLVDVGGIAQLNVSVGGSVAQGLIKMGKLTDGLSCEVSDDGARK